MHRTLDLTLAIPVYNSGSVLINLLSSIEKQSVLPGEIIFVDDASTDNSRNIIENFIYKNQELNAHIYTNEQNLGIAGTYNKLVSLANRKWIQILDADDHLIGEFYAVIEKHLTESTIAIVAGIRSNVSAVSGINVLFSRLLPKQLPIGLPMLGSFATRSGVIYSAKLLKSMPFIDPIFDGSDLIHFFDFRMHGKCIYEPNATIYYNIHQQAHSSKKIESKYLEVLRARREIPRSYLIDYFFRKKLFGFLRKL